MVLCTWDSSAAGYHSLSLLHMNIWNDAEKVRLQSARVCFLIRIIFKTQIQLAVAQKIKSRFHLGQCALVSCLHICQLRISYHGEADQCKSDWDSKKVRMLSDGNWLLVMVAVGRGRDTAPHRQLSSFRSSFSLLATHNSGKFRICDINSEKNFSSSHYETEFGF